MPRRFDLQQEGKEELVVNEKEVNKEENTDFLSGLFGGSFIWILIIIGVFFLFTGGGGFGYGYSTDK